MTRVGNFCVGSDDSGGLTVLILIVLPAVMAISTIKGKCNIQANAVCAINVF